MPEKWHRNGSCERVPLKRPRRETSPAVACRAQKASERLNRETLKALGLAYYWQRLLDEGKFRSITVIASAEGMDLGQVSRQCG